MNFSCSIILYKHFSPSCKTPDFSVLSKQYIWNQEFWEAYFVWKLKLLLLQMKYDHTSSTVSQHSPQHSQQVQQHALVFSYYSRVSVDSYPTRSNHLPVCPCYIYLAATSRFCSCIRKPYPKIQLFFCTKYTQGMSSQSAFYGEYQRWPFLLKRQSVLT